MYKKYIAVTNLNLCENSCENVKKFSPGSNWYDSYLKQIHTIASLKPNAILLREKQLDESVYYQLSKDVLKICEPYNTKVILHTFYDVAKKLNHPYLHLPLNQFKEIHHPLPPVIGTSVHSLSDLKLAEKFNASYVIAGNIYETDCKKGLAGRGLAFLENICKSTSLPVYAIGGITPLKYDDVMSCGAAGVCMMSGFMKMNP